MSKSKVKGVITSVLVAIYLITMVTGIIMFFFKSGMIFGIPRGYITATHSYSSFIMSGGVLVHFTLNFDIYKGEIKKLFKNSHTCDRA